MEEFKFPKGKVWHSSTAPFLYTGPRRDKPRGLWGLFKGRITYDETADIFNLGL
jgi:hypothetical protein